MIPTQMDLSRARGSGSRTIMLAVACFVVFNARAQRTVGLLQNDGAPEGYMLFAPMPYTSTYLIDACGREVHQWSSAYNPGLGAQLATDGSLYRSGIMNNAAFNGGGRGGLIERWSWDGTLLWSYAISTDSVCQHHDFTVLPNGNVLVIAWEKHTSADAIANGKNPAATATELWSERIIELQPQGNNGALVVWQWRLWDHLIQSFNTGLPHSGVVAEHPEKVDINFVQGPPLNFDWIHLNAIAYNPALDQIMVSSHALDEFWIVDHSTTMAEAAGSTGGNSGKGGDLLYRWGNPRSYGRGTVADQRLFGQHHTTWLPPGHPDAGKILVFNNGTGRPQGDYSSLDIIAPPVDANGNYGLPATTAFAPAAAEWSWTAPVPADFYGTNISGVLPAGDGFLATNGREGRFIYIDATEEQVWEYINPVTSTGPVAQGTAIQANSVFRCQHYAEDFPGFVGHDLTPGAGIELDPLPSLCLSMGVNASTTDHEPIALAPNPATNRVTITAASNITSVERIDMQGRVFAIPVGTTSDRITLLTSEWAAGTYALRMRTRASAIPVVIKLLIEEQ
ncbi:MAG: aryl-sulfate sulfotransferase [Flavobacteriales bacterium]|nr:aryl-sulfate sulfotransferase [Flavobacteriales bacterium]